MVMVETCVAESVSVKVLAVSVTTGGPAGVVMEKGASAGELLTAESSRSLQFVAEELRVAISRDAARPNVKVWPVAVAAGTDVVNSAIF